MMASLASRYKSIPNFILAYADRSNYRRKIAKKSADTQRRESDSSMTSKILSISGAICCRYRCHSGGGGEWLHWAPATPPVLFGPPGRRVTAG